MTIQGLAQHKTQINHALEISIQVGLATLLVVGCLMILRPFVPLIMWGIIIAVASYPTFLKVHKLLKGHGVLAAVLWTLALLAVLIVPLVLLVGNLVEGFRPLAARLQEGTFTVPPTPPTIRDWPLIGAPLASAWDAASANVSDFLMKFAPEMKAAIPGILSASAGFGLTVLQFLLAILVAGALLANAEGAARITSSLANRLFDEKGPEYQQLVCSTVRSVTFGILGVALIQSLFATIGFLVVGLPGAMIWTVIFLFGAILQAGALVLVPAVIYVFATASTTKAVIFLTWCIIVALMDNVLKPILLGRGVAVPVAVVFLGAIGGFVAIGIIGLFVGAIVLAVGYKLFLAWVGGEAAATPSGA